MPPRQRKIAIMGFRSVGKSENLNTFFHSDKKFTNSSNCLDTEIVNTGSVLAWVSTSYCFDIGIVAVLNLKALCKKRQCQKNHNTLTWFWVYCLQWIQILWLCGLLWSYFHANILLTAGQINVGTSALSSELKNSPYSWYTFL